ncbi:hypothetical protein [uncultured Anaerococcus sp.]|uniref:hypothetical protein n=1 Tax=uncultured Anaerococcus sp. TaxID=293428 RepID=UPI00288B7192|nr:hypothetical protein [uncultured Anaerococcus sp.]
MDFKIKRMDNGIYSIKTHIKGINKEEFECCLKKQYELRKLSNEIAKNNIGYGFRKGKIK